METTGISALHQDESSVTTWPSIKGKPYAKVISIPKVGPPESWHAGNSPKALFAEVHMATDTHIHPSDVFVLPRHSIMLIRMNLILALFGGQMYPLLLQDFDHRQILIQQRTLNGYHPRTQRIRDKNRQGKSRQFQVVAFHGQLVSSPLSFKYQRARARYD